MDNGYIRIEDLNDLKEKSFFTGFYCGCFVSVALVSIIGVLAFSVLFPIPA